MFWIFNFLDPNNWIQGIGSKQMGVPLLWGGGVTPNARKNLGPHDDWPKHPRQKEAPWESRRDPGGNPT